VEDYLHPAGVVILGCDERILSSDEDRWDEFVREAHEAESYRRKLARRVRQGLEARFDRHLRRTPTRLVRESVQGLTSRISALSGKPIT